MKRNESASKTTNELRRLRKAIRKKCQECFGGIKDNVRFCTLKDCALWKDRGGKEKATRK